MSVAYEKICEFSSPLSSPVEVDGALFMVAQNGDIFKFKEGQLKVIPNYKILLKTEFHFGGQPASIAVDKETKTIYLADMAHQAIIMRQMDEKNVEVASELVKEYEGMPLLGPNSLMLSLNMSITKIFYPFYQDALFFTDSGPFGETSLENCKGSVYMIDLDAQVIKPLALSCLAYPSGLVMSNDEKILYVCETCKNRVLRFVLTNQGIFYFSVYYQFSGRFGPTALAVSQSDLLYVGRFEFAQVSEEGQISVINTAGQIIENIVLPGCPEISGMTFSTLKSNILYVTENSSQPSCLRILVQLEDKEEGKKKDKDHTNSFRQQMLK